MFLSEYIELFKQYLRMYILCIYVCISSIRMLYSALLLHILYVHFLCHYFYCMYENMNSACIILR